MLHTSFSQRTTVNGRSVTGVGGTAFRGIVAIHECGLKWHVSQMICVVSINPGVEHGVIPAPERYQ